MLAAFQSLYFVVTIHCKSYWASKLLASLLASQPSKCTHHFVMFEFHWHRKWYVSEYLLLLCDYNPVFILRVWRQQTLSVITELTVQAARRSQVRQYDDNMDYKTISDLTWRVNSDTQTWVALSFFTSWFSTFVWWLWARCHYSCLYNVLQLINGESNRVGSVYYLCWAIKVKLCCWLLLWETLNFSSCTSTELLVCFSVLSCRAIKLNVHQPQPRH